MLMQAECSCHLVLFFSGRSVMGECLGVMCITITLLLHPTPLLILLAVARLNRLNPRTDWYIGACQRRCEELSLPTTLSLPLLYATTTPLSLPHELPRWQVINPCRRESGRFWGEEGEGGGGGGVNTTQTWRRFLLMHRKLFPPHRRCLPRGCCC